MACAEEPAKTKSSCNYEASGGSERKRLYIYMCVCRLKAEGAISLGGAASCSGGRPPSALTCIIL